MKTASGTGPREVADPPAVGLGDSAPLGLQRFALLAQGIVLAVAFTKLGNPVILDKLVPQPQTGAEWLRLSWPVRYGFVLLAMAGLVGALSWRRKRVMAPSWLLALPISWLVWQFVAASRSIDPNLSGIVLGQFFACTACFYLGGWVLGGQSKSPWFWTPVVAGLVWVLMEAFGQHYGGLEQTRRLLREQGLLEGVPVEFLKRLTSDRVFGTLFYPNTLAGLVLLVLPPAVVAAWQSCRRLSRVLQASLAGLLIYMGMAAVYWSGSKGGWLVAGGLLAVVAWHLVPAGRWRVGLAVLAVVGVVGILGIRFAGYFGRGAPSVVSRVDCWKAAVAVTFEQPLLGSGPGTFGVVYAQRKRPEAEMARLAHNDYVQQASDSGIPGFLLYLGFVGGLMGFLYRKSLKDPLHFAVWLGLLGWTLHSTLEFGLYIPAIGWTAFSFLGLLVGAVATNEHCSGQALTGR